MQILVRKTDAAEERRQPEELLRSDTGYLWLDTDGAPVLVLHSPVAVVAVALRGAATDDARWPIRRAPSGYRIDLQQRDPQ